MIETSPDTDISFFEALAQVVHESGLTPAEIARRANAQIKEKIAAIPDPAERLLTEAATPLLYRQTVSRAIKGETSVSKKTFSRIAMALNLSRKTYERLEKLREAEPYVHHSTQHRAVVRNGQPSPLPSWLDEESPI